MGGHPATLPFVLRTLQQLLSPGKAENSEQEQRSWVGSGRTMGASHQTDLRCMGVSCIGPFTPHRSSASNEMRIYLFLCVSDAPEALQAAGLRLMSRLWQASGGRAYPQLRAAVIGGLPRKSDGCRMVSRSQHSDLVPENISLAPMLNLKRSTVPLLLYCPCPPCRLCSTRAAAGHGSAGGASRVPA